MDTINSPRQGMPTPTPIPSPETTASQTFVPPPFPQGDSSLSAPTRAVTGSASAEASSAHDLGVGGAASGESMRTSSFAMSDMEDFAIKNTSPQQQQRQTLREQQSAQHMESLRLRKAYSQQRGTREAPIKKWRNGSEGTTIPETENLDYLDEKDFRNTDRYGFLQIPSSNCEAPETRNRAALSSVALSSNGSERMGSSVSSHGSTNNGISTAKRKILANTKGDILLSPRKSDEEKVREKEMERTKKWRDMAVIERPNGTIHYRFPITRKLMQRTFKGIPDCWRATVWHEWLEDQARELGNRETKAELIQSYYTLLDQDCEDDAQIDLDVPRTISEHIFFRKRYGAGQRLLFRVLHCISLKFPKQRYVQGMAPIAATLLCYYPDDIAFVMLVRLWQDKGLKNFFLQEFDGLMTAFKSLDETLAHRPVGKQLSALGIDPPNYATRWYLTLFNYSLPFHTQLRIWDVLMISTDGPAMLHATALALLAGLQDRLHGMDFERAMKFVTTRIDVQDDDKLMQLVFKEAKEIGALQFAH